MNLFIEMCEGFRIGDIIVSIVCSRWIYLIYVVIFFNFLFLDLFMLEGFNGINLVVIRFWWFEI